MTRWRLLLGELIARQGALTRFGLVLLTLLIPVIVAETIDPRTIDGANVWAKPAKFLTPVGQKPVEWVSMALFAVALAMTFVAWWRREHTLSIHAITTHRREGFYWAGIVAVVVYLTVRKPDRAATAD